MLHLARSGFVDSHEWKRLRVEMPPEVAALWDNQQRGTLTDLLALDPRPHYHDDPQRVYGMTFGGYDVRFRVADGVLTVVEVERL